MKKGLFFISIGLVAIALFLILGAAIISFSRPGVIHVPVITEKQRLPPISGFQQKKEDYDRIEETLLHLNFAPPRMQLPDLRKVLTYHGFNGRPDLQKGGPAVQFSILGSKEFGTIQPGQKLYLQYDKTHSPPRLIFSPDNKETTLWIEVAPDTVNRKGTVRAFMKNESGEIIRNPVVNAEFILDQKEAIPFNRPSNWEIGKFKVDGTLFSRQKAKWWGPDKFLQMHGGAEYEERGTKQRIEFGEGADAYTIYLGEGDFVVWDKDRWISIPAGERSMDKPLLELKKISDRILTFDLWTPDGNNKVVLNLLKSQERWSSQQLKQTIKFVAARTHSQYIFEIDQKRMLINPQDWLVKTEEGWEKLDSPTKIDDFVDGQLKGPLFIFDGTVQKEDESTVFMGSFFSPGRAEMETFEIPTQSTTPSSPSSLKSFQPSTDNNPLPSGEVFEGGGGSLPSNSLTPPGT